MLWLFFGAWVIIGLITKSILKANGEIAWGGGILAACVIVAFLAPGPQAHPPTKVTEQSPASPASPAPAGSGESEEDMAGRRERVRRFEEYARSQWAITDIHVDDVQRNVFVSLSPEKYTSKENVKYIAQMIARSYANSVGHRFGICTVVRGGKAYVVETAQGLNITAGKPEPTTPKPVILNLASIANKSQSEVASVLGNPTGQDVATAKGRSFPKYIYNDGDIEVVFVNGQAEWITVYGGGKLVYDETALQQLGVPKHSPTVLGAYTIRWDTIPGFREISLFPKAKGLSEYAYVCVNTLP